MISLNIIYHRLFSAIIKKIKNNKSTCNYQKIKYNIKYVKYKKNFEKACFFSQKTVFYKRLFSIYISMD